MWWVLLYPHPHSHIHTYHTNTHAYMTKRDKGSREQWKQNMGFLNTFLQLHMHWHYSFIFCPHAHNYIHTWHPYTHKKQGGMKTKHKVPWDLSKLCDFAAPHNLQSFVNWAPYPVKLFLFVAVLRHYPFNAPVIFH